MNRRSLLQLLGLAPAVAVLPALAETSEWKSTKLKIGDGSEKLECFTDDATFYTFNGSTPSSNPPDGSMMIQGERLWLRRNDAWLELTQPHGDRISYHIIRRMNQAIKNVVAQTRS